MHTRNPILVLCIIFATGTAAFAEDLSLGEYLNQVNEENPGLRSALLRAEALNHRIKPAGTWDDPFIAGGVDEKRFDGEMGSVNRFQVSQSIPFPGKLSTKSNIAENLAISAKSDSETYGREIRVLATQAFYRYYFNQHALELNQRLKLIVESTVGSTKARYKTGEAGHHDWLLAKVELTIFEVERLRLSREQKSIQAVLNEFRDRPATTAIGKVSAQFGSADPADFEIKKLENQPELKSLGYFISRAENEKKLAKLSYFPDFVIQGMAMYPNNEMMEEKSNWGFMIGITVPLYFWRKQSELSSAAKLDKEAAVLDRKILENRLNAETLEAQAQLQTSRDVAALYEQTVIPTTNLAVQNAKTGYAARRLTLAQYLDFLKVQRTQELEFLAAKIDVELAKTRIKELLSAPPLLRLAPLKPSLFGGSDMGASGMGSGAVNMGRGMRTPVQKSKDTNGPSDSGGAGMGNM